MPRSTKIAFVMALGAILFLGLCVVSAAPPATVGNVNPQSDTDPWADFLRHAESKFGERGKHAARFLSTHRPPRDTDIDAEMLKENLELAFRARDQFVWARSIAEEMFLNDVLPYAIIDETRERWRAAIFSTAKDIVAHCTSAAEAAQVLNRDLFTKLNVKYSTARAKPNQSALETMKSGIASCTGLSILMVNACRSVAIPARLAGISHWPDREGNHTWVEIWDGERWRFTGAAEYDANGLDRAWFSDAASHAIAGHQKHAIWATSWQTTGNHFPLAWNLKDESVPAVDGSHRYIRVGAAAQASLPVRLWESRGGKRLAARVRGYVADKIHESRTFADPDDINRVAELPLELDTNRPLTFTVAGETRLAWIDAKSPGTEICELYWDELSLSRDAAERVAAALWQEIINAERNHRLGELDGNVIRVGEHELKILHKTFGDPPPRGHSLWISMHGGGGAPAEVNDKQWANQAKLYQLEEGIYVAPRAPSNEWNLWHRAEIDVLFARLIESAIIAWNVDPDRVYLLGYSAGGDGVYQLAPRMADRFAAASMMAGHPNDASPLGLRNLPFAIFMGGKDAAYNRNEVAAKWGKQLDELHENDPDGYTHWVQIYPEDGHWMKGKDAEALAWLAKHTRSLWPKKIVWRQGNVPHERFYWLQVPLKDAQRGRTITAIVEGQTIAITAEHPCSIKLLLSDELLDLDQPIRVILNQKPAFEGRATRSVAVMTESLRNRRDPRAVATACIWIEKN